MGCIDCMVHAKVLGEVRREMLLWDSIGDRLTAGLSGTISWWCGLGLIVLMSVSSRPARRLLIAAITPPSCWRNLKRYQSVFLANKKQSNSITYMTVKPRLHQGIMLPGNIYVDGNMLPEPGNKLFVGATWILLTATTSNMLPASWQHVALV